MTIKKEIKYKLYWKDKFVGWEVHRISVNPYGYHIIHYHKNEPERGYLVTEKHRCRWVRHDEKRRRTGYEDVSGNDIFFGDLLRFPGQSTCYEVKMVKIPGFDEYQSFDVVGAVDIAPHPSSVEFYHPDFSRMELVP
jgi:hypothetical protein